ncbi:hypothetical protein PI124_g10692 [Phytophthora idaei]|nr:hypothetical protein PI125_g3461 [Phytophthora idaei]KAG3167781.1 hypothetical protein PI126_g3632 [Phytophthora idaei]KAG3244528.1 hypothetical protein PI124_g10692 [Phytophthora idaei]
MSEASVSAVWAKDLKPEGEDALEDSVSANIVLPLEKEGVVADVAGVLPRPSPCGRKAFRNEAIRRVAREAVYRLLKEAKREEVPPLCGKAPDLDWERLRWHAGTLRESYRRTVSWESSGFSSKHGSKATSPRTLSRFGES